MPAVVRDEVVSDGCNKLEIAVNAIPIISEGRVVIVKRENNISRLPS